MVTRFGQAKADAAAPCLDAGTTVTLCKLDTSKLGSSPKADSLVLAVAGESTWWASGALG
jgi:hypothetical protein